MKARYWIAMAAIAVVSIVVTVTFYGAIAYAVAHFVRKYW